MKILSIHNLLLAIVLFIVGLSACQPIDVTERYETDDKSNVPDLVIEGWVTNDPSRSFVRITKPMGIKDKVATTIADATVQITSTQGDAFDLSYVGNGMYRHPNLEGKNDGRVYNLRVAYAGKIYSASSTMPADLYPVDSLVFSFTNQENPFVGIDSTKLYAYIYARVTTASPEYYLFKFYKGDSLLNPRNSIYFADNALLNGSIKGLQLPGQFSVGDTAVYEIYSMPKEGYDMYLGLNSQLFNDGGVFSSPPANAKGNIQGAIGVFQAAYVQRGYRIAQP